MIKVYLVTLPGLENLALIEVYEWLGAWQKLFSRKLENFQPQVSNGGLEFEAPEELVQFFERTLKIPTRILQRVETFECTTMERLRSWISDFKKTEVGQKFRFDVHVFSRSSELFHKKNIEDICERVLNKNSKSLPDQRIDFRFFRNECTVSLDRSGEKLYKRGYKKYVGEAPLRENMASAFIRQTMKGLSPDSWSQYEFVDAMCGSGTFTLEAHFINRILEAKIQQKDEIEKIYRDYNAALPQSLFHSFLLNDRSEKQLGQAKMNLEGLVPLSQWSQLDLSRHQSYWPNEGEKERVVLLNPPYGQRLKRDQYSEHLSQILNDVARVYRPARIGVVYPDEMRDWPSPKNYEIVEFVRLEHGGIPVRFMTWAREPSFSSPWPSSQSSK